MPDVATLFKITLSIALNASPAPSSPARFSQLAVKGLITRAGSESLHAALWSIMVACVRSVPTRVIAHFKESCGRSLQPSGAL